MDTLQNCLFLSFSVAFRSLELEFLQVTGSYMIFTNYVNSTPTQTMTRMTTKVDESGSVLESLIAFLPMKLLMAESGQLCKIPKSLLTMSILHIRMTLVAQFLTPLALRMSRRQ
jgi:hypothetical protein